MDSEKRDQPKTVLITGAATRVGREIALHLAREGWDIVVHSRQTPADAVLEAIHALGRKAIAVQGDLADAAAPARLIAEAGPLTALVNCAAMFEKDDLTGLDTAQFDAHMAINLRAPLLLAQAFAAQLTGKGAIVNILDGCDGLCISPNFLTYSLSKKGLEEATRLLATGLVPRIRVNAVAPGLTLPKPGEEAMFDRLVAKSPLQVASSPEEVAVAVSYLLATESLTGQVISLNGGLGLGS